MAIKIDQTLTKNSMIFLAVNFHYVDDEAKYIRGIYPVSPERFSHQLDELGKNFTFVGQQDIIDALDGKKNLPERSCLVTFDDGLRCQFENALPVLEKKGIPTILFVNSYPYTDGLVSMVHQIHWLLAHALPADFERDMRAGLSGIGQKNVDEYIESLKPPAKLKYRYDVIEVAVVKYILNSVLGLEERQKIVSEIFKKYITDEKAFAENLYLTKDQVRKLYQKGFLGIHGHNHAPLSMLLGDIEKNVLLNKKTIEEIAGGEVFCISYPYGNKQDINTEAVGVYEKMGLRFGFTMERAFNASLKNPLLFARSDTNDAPGGKSPCFSFKGGEVKITGNLSPSRQMFFLEK